MVTAKLQPIQGLKVMLFDGGDAVSTFSEIVIFSRQMGKNLIYIEINLSIHFFLNQIAV